MEQDLTKNQSIIFGALNQFLQRKGYPPTLLELKEFSRSRGLKVKSLNSIAQYLNALEQKGYLIRDPE
jgi:SOS-response transcriptional repressor LexA